MGIGAADAQAGTGGIDGDTQNLVQFETPDTGDDAKVTYFTPRIVASSSAPATFRTTTPGLVIVTTPISTPKAPRRTSSAPASTGPARSVQPT